MSVDKSSGASAAFSSRALAMARERSAQLAAAKRPAVPAQEAAPPRVPASSPLPGSLAGSVAFSLPAGARPSLRPLAAVGAPKPARIAAPAAPAAAAAPARAAPAPIPASADPAAQWSDQARAMPSGGRPATTVEAGAPAGSGARLRAYGAAQQALAPTGGGFDAQA